MSKQPLLKATGISKDYRQGDGVPALDCVDLQISAREFVAIMGASGSGKSTLLHALAGLCSVDTGSICIEGRDLVAMKDAELTRFRRERIGLVFQAFNLIPTLSAEDNVRLPALGQPDLETSARDLLARLGMADRRSYKPDALSGGEQQRVAIARALVCNPAVVLADEPTGSLDSVAGQEVCQLLRELCDRDGVSIAMVTHDAEVARWADRIVVLKDGRVVDAFTRDEDWDAQSLGHRYRKAVN